MAFYGAAGACVLAPYDAARLCVGSRVELDSGGVRAACGCDGDGVFFIDAFNVAVADARAVSEAVVCPVGHALEGADPYGVGSGVGAAHDGVWAWPALVVDDAAVRCRRVGGRVRPQLGLCDAAVGRQRVCRDVGEWVPRSSLRVGL